MPLPIVIVDYGAGNLRSVARAVAYAGEEPIVTGDGDAFERCAGARFDGCAGVILPGVGAAQDTMANLEGRGLAEPIRAYIAAGRPFLGVCMGMQALFDRSEEGGGQDCLGIIPGEIRRFSAGPRKVPHMGWNTVDWAGSHPVIDAIPSGSYFYFVHSYYPAPRATEIVLGWTDYDGPFASVIAQDNVIATQFHPEKSGEYGLRLYANFCHWARASRRPSAALGSTA